MRMVGVALTPSLSASLVSARTAACCWPVARQASQAVDVDPGQGRDRAQPLVAEGALVLADLVGEQQVVELPVQALLGRASRAGGRLDGLVIARRRTLALEGGVVVYDPHGPVGDVRADQLRLHELGELAAHRALVVRPDIEGDRRIGLPQRPAIGEPCGHLHHGGLEAGRVDRLGSRTLCHQEDRDDDDPDEAEAGGDPDERGVPARRRNEVPVRAPRAGGSVGETSFVSARRCRSVCPGGQAKDSWIGPMGHPDGQPDAWTRDPSIATGAPRQAVPSGPKPPGPLDRQPRASSPDVHPDMPPNLRHARRLVPRLRAVETASQLWYDRGMTGQTPSGTALARAGYRLTEPRLALSALIAERTGHFTAAELVAEARGRRLGIGRATVFRTLEVLEALGTIERLDLPNGEHAYVGCAPAHHHHVVCSRCGRTSEIRDADLRRVVDDVARQTGYRVDEHRLEFFGLCPTCLAGEPGPAGAPG